MNNDLDALRISVFYVGFLGRAATPEELDAWQPRLAAARETNQSVGDLLRDIGNEFVDAENLDETFAVFRNPQDATVEQIDALVADLFENLFNRQPDTAAFAFWRNDIQARAEGGRPLGDIVIDVALSARNTTLVSDASTMVNRIDAAAQYTQAVSQEDASLVTADEVVDRVTADPASVDAALNATLRRAPTRDETAPTIPENQVFRLAGDDEGAVLGTVRAEDDGEVTDFRITDGNRFGALSIDDDGNIALSRVGAMLASNDAIRLGVFSLEVVATDAAGNTSAPTTVRVDPDASKTDPGTAPDGDDGRDGGDGSGNEPPAPDLTQGLMVDGGVFANGEAVATGMFNGRPTTVRITGSAEVDDASALETTGRGQAITLNEGGRLDVADGTVATQTLMVAESGFAEAAVRGGTINISPDRGPSVSAPRAAGRLQLGRDADSEGLLTLDDGASLVARTRANPPKDSPSTAPGLILGQEAGSVGTLIARGSETTIQVLQETQAPIQTGVPQTPTSAFVEVGSGLGQGNLTLEGSRLAIEGPGAFLGVGDAQTGEAGARNTELSNSLPTSRLTLRDGAEISVDATSGTARDDAFVVVAQREGASGRIDLGGTDTALTMSGDFPQIHVGFDGQGELNVRNGATVSASLLTLGRGVVEDGADSSGQGAMTLSGTDTLVRLTGRDSQGIANSLDSGGGALVVVGFFDRGTLMIENGAALEVESTGGNPGLVVGHTTLSNGRVSVTGDDSTLQVTSTNSAPEEQAVISIGRGGTGSLTVANGAEVSTDGVSFVGRKGNFEGPDAQGTLVVRGDGSVFDAGAQLHVGRNPDIPAARETVPGLEDEAGQGVVRVLNGAELEADTAWVGSSSEIALGAGGTVDGDLIVEGTLALSEGGASTIQGGLRVEGEIALDALVSPGDRLLEVDGAIDIAEANIVAAATNGRGGEGTAPTVDIDVVGNALTVVQADGFGL